MFKVFIINEYALVDFYLYNIEFLGVMNTEYLYFGILFCNVHVFVASHLVERGLILPMKG